jgi:signal transduction histidine kinase
MKNLRRLIVLNAVLLLALGFGMALFWPRSLPVVFKQYQEAATIRFLGAIVGGMGLVLYMLRNLILSDERRRLALGLSAASFLVSSMATIQEGGPVWVKPLGWVLILLPLGMSGALAWAGLRPIRLEETAESLPIPDEVRRSWLRQIGEAAVQEERNRLARDLHDSIKQQLFTISVSAAATQELWDKNQEKAKTALADVRRSAREAMVEMQALLHQLQPKTLASAGLVEALREQCEALGYRTGSEVLLELGEAIPDDRLPPGTQETLFRIAQEALSNIARHARARKIRVGLGREGDSALLRVEDDGQGFDPAVATSGMGLRNLRERAASLRGTLELSSAPGAGTAITVRTPLALPPEPSPFGMAAAEAWIRAFFLSVLAALWITRPLVTSDSWTNAFATASLSAVLLMFAIRWRQLGPDSKPEHLAGLRYVNHRDSALAFLLAAGWTPWLWRIGSIWRGWTFAWFAVALLCVGLTIVELVQLHRNSTVRYRWWRMPRFRPTLRGWIFLGVFSYVVAFTFGTLWLGSLYDPNTWTDLRPFRPAELVFLLLAAVVLLYIRSRQPRTEGASA